MADSLSFLLGVGGTCWSNDCAWQILETMSLRAAHPDGACFAKLHQSQGGLQANKIVKQCIINFLFGISCEAMPIAREYSPSPAPTLHQSLVVLIVDHSWQRTKLAGTDKAGRGEEKGDGIWTLKRERERGGAQKLQHISGIFQLTMCGCGGAREKEPNWACFVQ